MTARARPVQAVAPSVAEHLAGFFRPRWRRIALFAAAVAVLTVVVVGAFHLAPEPDGTPRASFRDFRDATYEPARAVLHGDNPYDVAHQLAAYPVEQEFPAYGPQHLLLHVPFALLPDTAARIAFLALGFALTIAVAHVALRMLAPAAVRWGTLPLAAVLALSYPGAVSAYYGQTTLEVVLGAYLAAGRDRRTGGDRLLAALGIALTLQKPQLGVPLVVLFAFGGRLRTALEGIGTALLLSAPIVVTLSFAAGGPSALVRSILDGVQATGAAGANDLASPQLARIDLAATVARVTGVALPAVGQAALALAVLAGAAVLLRRARRAGLPLPLGVITLATLLATPNLPYSALLAVCPLLLADGAGSADPRWRAARFAVTAPLASLTIAPAALADRLGLPGISVPTAGGLLGGCLVAGAVLETIAVRRATTQREMAVPAATAARSA